MSVRDLASRVASIAALAEPVRRALYLYVAGQSEPVSRDQAAAALGVARHVAKFNLDKLEEERLLEVEYARPSGRGGPGAGRPAKLYKRSTREVSVSLPDRHYDLAARIMAQAITASERDAVPIGQALSTAAREAGQALGESARLKAGDQPDLAATLSAIQEVLTDQGYQPRAAGRELTLANCPFHSLAQTYAALVCKINLDLIDSMLTAAGFTDVRAEFRPAPGQCCVQVNRQPPAP